MPFPGNIRVVLVQPEFPGNVGAAARAMQTMGLSELVVVDPVCDPLAEEAFWMATSAGELLRGLRVVPTLQAALADTVFSVGTTRRIRRIGYPVFTPEEAAVELRQRAAMQPAAIVFGRESSGLDNPELALCSIHSTIPCAAAEHSLNLAQAVQLYCYALHRSAMPPEILEYPWKLATHEDWEHFYAHLRQTLVHLRTKPATTMDNYLARFRRVLSRVPLETRDLNLLHRLLSRVDQIHPPE
ncbi:MAG: RNA methyltransferase [Planctomycetales bacterium]